MAAADDIDRETMVSLLKDKEVPDQLRKELEDVRDAMKKT
jgi:hypothetical protein